MIKKNFNSSVSFKNIKIESYKGLVTIVKLIKCIFEETKILIKKSYLKETEILDRIRQFVENLNNSVNYQENFKNCKAITIIKENVSKNYQSLTENLVIENNLKKLFTISSCYSIFFILCCYIYDLLLVLEQMLF